MKPAFAAFLAALITSPAALAHDMSTPQGAANEPYAPRIGEIMALQQIRHIKLWFAGRSGDWPLADYEVDALKQGFEDVNKQIGGDTVEQVVGAAVSAIEKAIWASEMSGLSVLMSSLALELSP